MSMTWGTAGSMISASNGCCRSSLASYTRFASLVLATVRRRIVVDQRLREERYAWETME